MDDTEVRLTKMEMEVDILKREFHGLSTEAMGMKEELRAIQKNLNQIKWFAMGATALYASSTTGMLKFITAFGV